MEKKLRNPKDKWILFAFLGFFGVIFTVDAFFIHKAISTQTGVITENAYEKGLGFNKLLQEAKDQPNINDKISFNKGILTWQLGVDNAEVSAHIIRPIQEGHDFDIKLNHVGNGIYEAPLDLPFKGLWDAKLESKWTQSDQTKTYKTSYQFIKK